LDTSFALLCLMLPIIVSGVTAFYFTFRASWLRLILAFSAAYLFSLSIMHLLPQAYSGGNMKMVGLFIVIGFCVQLLIDTFSAGIEHGHVHLHGDNCQTHLPYGIIIGLCLHSFLEGLPVYNINSVTKINYQLVLGLGIHNIPITIAFATLLGEHEKSRMKRYFILLLFSLMSPLGLLTGYLFYFAGLHDYLRFSNQAYALVIGIFLHISTAILFESGEQHKYNSTKVVAMLLGIMVAYFIS